ncbi:DNA-directed RNA polymerase subunit omega [bacterium]|nr:DNA-directed RNA polymerase subunit omega [bacterium]MBU1637168.1 DNA-directed RNA polymerase subunit omega [bacterium]MBU1919266.1 DNA-directed RNA polymerase subunit omega [bacterium]
MRVHDYFHPEAFIDKADSIYEAVLIISRRARQIGELQKRRIDRHLGQTEMLEQAAARARAEEGDDVVEPEPIDRSHIQFEKPVVLALREMLAGEIEYFYEE